VSANPKLASLIRDLHKRAAALHVASGDHLTAMGELYRVGEPPGAEILKALGLSGSIRTLRNRPKPTYFQADHNDPCSFGLLEITDDRLQRQQFTTLPLEVYRILEDSFDFFKAEGVSGHLTRAAYHAFQAGFLNHAAYLARKACEFNPDNTVAQRSRAALLGKGACETGNEQDCLETILVDRPAVHNALQRLGLNLA